MRQTRLHQVITDLDAGQAFGRRQFDNYVERPALFLTLARQRLEVVREEGADTESRCACSPQFRTKSQEGERVEVTDQ